MDTPLIMPARLFFTVAVGLGMSQPLPVVYKAEISAVQIKRALAVKLGCLCTESTRDIERLAQFCGKWNKQSANRNVDFSRDYAELFDVALDIREVAARGGIESERHACSAKQLYVRIHAAAAYGSAENQVRFVEVKNNERSGFLTPSFS